MSTVAVAALLRSYSFAIFLLHKSAMIQIWWRHFPLLRNSLHSRQRRFFDIWFAICLLVWLGLRKIHHWFLLQWHYRCRLCT
jgi:hypothetical protein